MASAHDRQTAVITGASSGIGAVYADRLAGRGYDLILVARRRDRLQALAEKLRSAHGVSVEIITADLEADSDVARIEDVLRTNPAVSVLVNNAGLARMGSVAQSTPGDAKSQIAVNIIALSRLTQAALPGFLARNEGLIINIGSVLGFHTLPVSAVYSGTKAFVMGFTRGVQQEVAGTNVKVQLVMPAATATEIWDASGVPLSSFDKQTVMTTEDMVDAALTGLDNGEIFTLPSVADESLWETYDAARGALFAGGRTGTPAPRYRS